MVAHEWCSVPNCLSDSLPTKKACFAILCKNRPYEGGFFRSISCFKAPRPNDRLEKTILVRAFEF